MQQTKVTFSYPLYLDSLGPAGRFTFSTPTAELSGNYLVYAFLIATDAEEAINLDFLPDGALRAVQVWRQGQWQDMAPSDSTDVDLRSVVQRRFGDRVYGLTRYVFGGQAQKAGASFRER